MKYSWNDLGYLCVGFVLSGIGCTLYACCGLGSGSFNVLVDGIARTLEIQIGTAFYLAQGCLLLLIIPVWRRYIGVGTVLGAILVGYVMNLGILIAAPLLQSGDYFIRLCTLATAPVFIGFGIAFVEHSGLGLVPYDIVPLILHARVNQLRFSMMRVLVDAVTFLIGFALGGTIGLGTLISVLMTGPGIQLATEVLDRRICMKESRHLRQKMHIPKIP